MIEVRKKSELGGGDFGWLKAFHHFDIGRPGGNRLHTPIGPLYVFNDDEFAAGTGFLPHQHKDVEIITYVRDGKILHTDSLGSIGTIDAGDVQVMSAGTGIRHSELAGGDCPAKVFQIWIAPRTKGGKPSWFTKQFPRSDRSGNLVVLASGITNDDGALPLNADARVLGAVLQRGEKLKYQAKIGEQIYIVTTFGSIEVNGTTLKSGDGAVLHDEKKLKIECVEPTEIIVVEV